MSQRVTISNYSVNYKRIIAVAAAVLLLALSYVLLFVAEKEIHGLILYVMSVFGVFALLAYWIVPSTAAVTLEGDQLHIRKGRMEHTISVEDIRDIDYRGSTLDSMFHNVEFYRIWFKSVTPFGDYVAMIVRRPIRDKREFGIDYLRKIFRDR